MKIQSFNVNGIRAISKKQIYQEQNFFEWIKNSNVDIIGFQETKVWAEQLTEDFKKIEGYHPLFLSQSHRKGYSGVGLLVKNTLDVKLSLDFFNNNLDHEGRINILEHPNFTLLNVYFPNGASKKERLNYKMEFYHQFLLKCKERLDNGENIIVMGDVNTAHKAIDLSHPKDNEKKSGFLPMERTWIDDFLKIGFTDSFRFFFPDQIEKYTWWDMKTRARERNIGWRIDYIYISPGLLPYLKSANILTDVYGSDHCPIEIELDL